MTKRRIASRHAALEQDHFARRYQYKLTLPDVVSIRNIGG